MRRTNLAVALVLGWSICATASQQKPNFSGRWIVVSPAEAAGEEQTVRHAETTLTLNHDSSGGGHEIVFVLDGKENKSTMQSHGSAVVTTYRAEWKGSSLTITSSTTYEPDRRLEQVQVW